MEKTTSVKDLFRNFGAWFVNLESADNEVADSSVLPDELKEELGGSNAKRESELIAETTPKTPKQNSKYTDNLKKQSSPNNHVEEKNAVNKGKKMKEQAKQNKAPEIEQ